MEFIQQLQKRNIKIANQFLPLMGVLSNYNPRRNADIVEGSAFSFFDNGKLSRRFKHKEKIKQVNPVKEFLGYPWGKVYKSKIFEKYHFPEGYLFEAYAMI